MSHKLINEFYWYDRKEQHSEKLTDTEKYQQIVDWALKARGQNPNVFDSLTEWILDDAEWCEEKMVENEQILMQGILARLKEQNTLLRAFLKDLEQSGVVNSAIWKALDRFDDVLSGLSLDQGMQEIVAHVFADFSVMQDRSIREQIAGNKTGPDGTDSVDLYGYINCLKDCDAGVQWALFMPQVVERQQDGFRVESFEYKRMPPMRLIGFEGEEYADVQKRVKKMQEIRSLTEYQSELDYDVLFMHHYGLGVDVGEWHGVWGRFMKADTPVPEGFISFDFVPQRDAKNSHAGPPYLSQFAYAVFSGSKEAMHKREGFDSDAMYDVTRNIILGQGVSIPYPDKYWTAEAFLDGCDKFSTAYLFSAEL